MKLPTIFWKKFLGIDVKNEQKVEAKIEQAHAIKNAITRESLVNEKKIYKINKKTYDKLVEITNDLASVTYSIAIATGGKKRGL